MSVSVYCILATVTYKTQMRNYIDIMALQCKGCGEKTMLNAKNSPNMIAYSFFHDRKDCTVANPEIVFSVFSVTTDSNLFLSTSSSLPTSFLLFLYLGGRTLLALQSLLLSFQENSLHNYEKTNLPTHIAS